MRLALGVAYDGRAYQGWQSQASGLAVQDKLEAALSTFAAAPVQTVCAGRTDAGVHGLMQVVHFDTAVERTPFSWVRGTNRYLPADIAVQWAQPVSDDFHARFLATSRRYAYVLLESPVRPALEAGRVGWAFRPLNGEAMRQAAQHLLGEHDFSSFRASSCQAKSPVKTLLRAEVTRREAGAESAYWRFDFEGNAFLHHMIRNIMGCLLAVGQGTHKPGWIREVIAARSRDAAAPTFSPDGLYFLGPVYDAHWGLPTRTPAFDWIP
ncbi:tRNA pseudouridine(38-40) synthase TruA [Xylophilus rhododendri]|uniref:tRNA pseudouridine synthase A n=1 Tax=Xylophilus rhododendri TaxID=2697032 RepID=A0A857JCN2_9BURK|nr:tRNA pseudouridine(38-40) synthase TruA [Xylophilus rhododendri]QHJ00723.1 tRNA pseudouridine(38-40) synthase TruA [Xylophilus rhododendri]